MCLEPVVNLQNLFEMKPERVAYACNLSTRKVEAGRSQAPWLVVPACFVISRLMRDLI